MLLFLNSWKLSDKEKVQEVPEAWSEIIWKVVCPECKNEFVAPEYKCMSGAKFQAECSLCLNKFPAWGIQGLLEYDVNSQYLPAGGKRCCIEFSATLDDKWPALYLLLGNSGEEAL
ncbi:hypothetical protein [Microbulbifer variabilis]|uniref:Uncharacterized protein n=1 Tax=Microbulbifer variabilis TaxID=266805 RepID=A0ABY4VGG3_9GAMM|nr:hypothetical protein [Microbulbifer variabilis]USD23377.1 hypothetical protein MJO52_09635 [Microbulbifer variabilis]